LSFKAFVTSATSLKRRLTPRLTLGEKTIGISFARGALVAAKWVVGKEAGLYTMFDVLGI